MMKTKILLGIIVLFGLIYSDLFISCKHPVIESKIPDQTTKSQDDPEQKDDSQEPPKESSKKIKFTATPTNEGLLFQWDNVPNDAKRFQIYVNDWLLFINDVSRTSIIDKFVDIGKEYMCGIIVEDKDGNRIWSDKVFIIPTTGLGEPMLLNTPIASFDNIFTITFDVLPQVNLPDTVNWDICFRYKNEESNYWGDMYVYNSKTSSNSIKIRTNSGYGVFVFTDYIINFDLDGAKYFYQDRDISKIPNIPSTIELSEEIIQQNKFRLIATPTSEGIKFEWANIPQNAKKLTIIIKKNNDNKKYFDINDITKVNSVIDKYVTNGNTYECFISAYNENNQSIDSTSWITVTATGGLGDYNGLIAEATNNGIHLSGENDVPDSICKELADDNQNRGENYIYLKENISAFDIIDFFVSPGKTYRYSITKTIGNKGKWINGILTDADDIVERRTIFTTVTATGGYGDTMIMNNPSVTFDSSDQTLSLSSPLQIAGSPTSFEIMFFYKNTNHESKPFFHILPNGGISWIIENVTEGQWVFDYYVCHNSFEEYRYRSQRITDLSVFQNFPQIVNINNANKPRLSVIPTDEGLMFQWENAPENVEQIELIFCMVEMDGNFNGEINLYLNDVTQNSFLYKYVDSEKDYYCFVGFNTADGKWHESNYVTITSVGGLGELKIVNEPSATFNNGNIITFNELPQVTASFDLDWTVSFWYRNGTNWRPLFSHSSTEQNYDKLIYSQAENGTWLYDQCRIYFSTNSFRGEKHIQNISNLTGVPQTIVLSEL